MENEELGRISEYSSLEIDKVNNQLVGYSRNGAWGSQTEYFEYRDGRVEFIKMVERLFILETMDNHDEKHVGQTFITISELVDNKLTVTEEYYTD